MNSTYPIIVIRSFISGGLVYFAQFLLFFVFITPFSQSIVAQNTSLYFNHLTRDDGLLSNRVNYITEDSLGFIWFATEEGLEKFDGYGFEAFKDFLLNDNNTTSDNAVNFVLEDTRKPNLWIATHQGLIYFDRYKNSFKLVLSDEFKNRPSETINITSLCFDRDKNLWIATLNGLFIWDTHYKKLTTLIDNNLGNQSRVFTLFADNRGIIWVGSDKGLYAYHADSKILQHLYTEISSVRVITQDSQNNFWIGTDNAGLFRIDDINKKEIIQHFSRENGSFVSNRISGIVEDEPGIFFILVRDGGLYRYNNKTGEMKFYPYDLHNPDGINSTALITSFKSSQNIIWIGTYNSGVNYLDKAQKKFMLYRVNFKSDGLLNNNIRALAEDSQGNIWIGTKEGGGLSRFDKEKGTFKNYPKTNKTNGLRDDYIFSLCEMDNQRLLVGTFREGLAVFNKNDETFKYYIHIDKDVNSLSDNRVYTIFNDSEQTLWVGNYYDLQIFNPVSETFKTIKGVKRPRCICEESSNMIWVGTKDNGICLVDRKEGLIRKLISSGSDTNSISSNNIYALVKDQQGNLWVGTKRGLNKINLTNNTITRYTEKDGLPANWIRGLLIDDNGNIWASTTNGLSKFDVEHDVFHNYDVKDRLQGNEFERYVALKTHDGYMLFGGHNGFNIFKPGEITDNKIIPPVYITGISLLNKDVVVGAKNSPLKENILFTNHLTLSYNHRVVTINYAALNYTSPEKNHYAYTLEGFVQDWVPGNNRSAVFTNIPPGDYVFRVIGSNNDGYWNRKGAKLGITVLPPPWKTTWAYIIYIFLLALIILLIRRIMIVRIEQKKLLEFERMDKKRIQEINQSKLRFFTNISHEFRTPLTLISSPLNKLLEANNYTEEQGYLFRLINNNVKRLLILVSELMDFRKTEYGQYKLNVSENDLIDEIEESIECFAEKAGEKGISLTFIHTDKPVLGWFDKNILDKVLFNLLSNAVKYTPQHGEIKIELKVNENRQACVSISNTGKGIPKDKIENIFDRFFQVEDETQMETTGTGIGLAFSKRLIETHKGSIAVDSAPGKLTTFSIKFPVAKVEYQQEEFVQKESSEMKKTSTRLEAVEFIPANENQELAEKLLIVEDNDELRDYLKTIFSSYSLMVAADGKEGVALATEQVPDIIVSDIIMPEMDGIGLCARVKSNLITSHIPVILLTAKSDIQHKIKGIETGADAYIEKPFDTEYLMAMVKNLLLQRKKIREKFSDNPGQDMDKAGLNKKDKQFIEKIKLIIEENISSPDFSVDKLSTELGVSRSQLFRKFNALFNLKPNELIRSERLKYAKKLLQQKQYNVNEVALKAGFASTSYFITSFKKYFGETPSHFLHH
jgi:signal transduction histidine kinase/ligand-binding sensor domain-containing protein/DNA-binding response OmpR family regulator